MESSGRRGKFRGTPPFLPSAPAGETIRNKNRIWRGAGRGEIGGKPKEIQAIADCTTDNCPASGSFAEALPEMVQVSRLKISGLTDAASRLERLNGNPPRASAVRGQLWLTIDFERCPCKDTCTSFVRDARGERKAESFYRKMFTKEVVPRKVRRISTSEFHYEPEKEER